MSDEAELSDREKFLLSKLKLWLHATYAEERKRLNLANFPGSYGLFSNPIGEILIAKYNMVRNPKVHSGFLTKIRTYLNSLLSKTVHNFPGETESDADLICTWIVAAAVLKEEINYNEKFIQPSLDIDLKQYSCIETNEIINEFIIQNQKMNKMRERMREYLNDPRKPSSNELLHSSSPLSFSAQIIVPSSSNSNELPQQTNPMPLSIEQMPIPSSIQSSLSISQQSTQTMSNSIQSAGQQQQISIQMPSSSSNLVQSVQSESTSQHFSLNDTQIFSIPPPKRVKISSSSMIQCRFNYIPNEAVVEEKKKCIQEVEVDDKEDDEFEESENSEEEESDEDEESENSEEEESDEDIESIKNKFV